MGRAEKKFIISRTFLPERIAPATHSFDNVMPV